MATLDPGNIVNGNTIQTSDLLQLYKAFGTGSGDSITGLAMTGSLYGDALTATTSSHALSASKITTTTTSSGVYYPVVVSGVGTNLPRLVSTFELSGSILNNITASRAITASYALNGGSTATQVDSQRYIDSSNPATVNSGNFKFVAGGGILNSGVITSSAYPDLAGKLLGRNAWITATYIGDASAITSAQPTLVVNLSSSGAVIVEQINAQNDSEVVWTGIYI